MKYNNGTLGDMKVKVYIRVIVIDGFSRTMPDEATTMQRYRESIFCPCFRGDRPDVKRFFDVLLSGLMVKNRNLNFHVEDILVWGKLVLTLSLL